MRIKRAIVMIILCSITIIVFTSCSRVDTTKYREGDIFFQVSSSRQSVAIQKTTASKFSHMGILVEHDHALQIFEAVQPVNFTDLDTWVRRGKDGYFEVKRCVNADSLLSQPALAALHQFSKSVTGRNYDKLFLWGDDEMYCSELVWKAYQRCIGVQLCPLKHLRDFNLSDPVVAMTLGKRYGTKIPYDELVVSPADIYNANILMSVR